MEKVYGATERHDILVRFGSGRSVLIFGYGEEDGMGYDYRHTFDHYPTKEELMAVINEQVNADTDEKILNGYIWDGKHVYLSTENQFNFKAAYDLAAMSGGSILPIKFKLGEDSEGNPVYHTFSTLEEFTSFYTGAIAFVQTTLNEGWIVKDSVDYEHLLDE